MTDTPTTITISRNDLIDCVEDAIVDSKTPTRFADPLRGVAKTISVVGVGDYIAVGDFCACPWTLAGLDYRDDTGGFGIKFDDKVWERFPGHTAHNLIIEDSVDPQ